MDLKLAIFKPMLKLAMERTGHGAALGFELTKVGRGEVEMTFPTKQKWWAIRLLGLFMAA